MQMQRGHRSDVGIALVAATMHPSSLSNMSGSETQGDRNGQITLNTNAKTENQYNNSAYDANNSSSVASPISHIHKSAEIMSKDNVIPSRTHRFMMASFTNDSERLHKSNSSTLINNDEEALSEMIHLNNILADFQTEMLILDGNNRLLTNEMQRLQKPLEAFAQLELAIKQNFASGKYDWSMQNQQLLNDFAKYKTEAEDLRAKYNFVENARRDQIAKIDILMTQIADLNTEIRYLRAQSIEFDERYQLALAENQRMSSYSINILQELEIERQKHARLENQLKRMASKAQEYELLMNKLRTEVTAFTARPDYEIRQADLTHHVEQIRRDYEMSRDKLKENFDVRIAEFYRLCTKENKHTEKLRLEVAELRAERDCFAGISEKNASLEARIATLEHELSVANHRYDLVKDKHTIDDFRWAEVKKIFERDHSALNEKSKLYGEVVIYRDILEAKPHFEDGGLIYVTDPVKQKRKRYNDKLIRFSQGKITFGEIDHDGSFITLKNMTKHAVNMQNWSIEQIISGSHEIKFQVPEGVVIAPGKKLKVWAYGSGNFDPLPGQIFFKQQRQWGIGKVQTFLFDDQGREHASCTPAKSRKQKIVM